MVNYYIVLGVPEDAHQSVILAAYNSLTEPAEDADGRMRDCDLIDQAKKTLMNAGARTRYINKLRKCEQKYNNAAAVRANEERESRARAEAMSAEERRQEGMREWDETKRRAEPTGFSLQNNFTS
ncbi:MAG: hypothetical protein Q9226_006222 [Calogaya cf. arnoldii]